MKKFEIVKLLQLLVIALIVLLIWLRVPSDENKRVDASLVAAGDYLISAVDETGMFAYNIDVVTGVRSDDYNMLRHAGTIFAMMQLYEITNDNQLRLATERALQYLQSKTEVCYSFEEFDVSVLCVNDDNKLKLGGNALAILAYEKYREVTGSTVYEEDSEALARWILLNQSENGEFTNHIQYAITGERDSHISEYYPGEAIFALVSLHNRTENQRYLDAAEYAAEWLITVRDKGKTSSNLVHDHWLLYGLHAIGDAKGIVEDIYYKHAIKISSAIIASQNTTYTGGQFVWNGGFGASPRTTPAATRIEGLHAMYQMMEIRNDPRNKELVRDVKNAIILGSEFLFRTQITKTVIETNQLSEKSLGSFPNSLALNNTRIDYTQHAISALLGYRDIYNK